MFPQCPDVEPVTSVVSFVHVTLLLDMLLTKWVVSNLVSAPTTIKLPTPFGVKRIPPLSQVTHEPTGVKDTSNLPKSQRGLLGLRKRPTSDVYSFASNQARSGQIQVCTRSVNRSVVNGCRTIASRPKHSEP